MSVCELWFSSILCISHGTVLTDTGKNSLSLLSQPPLSLTRHMVRRKISPLTLASGWPLKVQCVKTKEALWRAQRRRGHSPGLPAPPPHAQQPQHLAWGAGGPFSPASFTGPGSAMGWSLPEAGQIQSFTSSHTCSLSSLCEEHRPKLTRMAKM